MNTAEQIQNCKAALEAWQHIPSDGVNLANYRCGAVHCFGGWLPTMPYFAGLGVYCDENLDGMPALQVGEGDLVAGALSVYLFGSPPPNSPIRIGSLFAPRMDLECMGEYRNLTDWEVVERRLQNQITYLSQL